MRGKGSVIALLAAFFASGVASLAFETLWFHQAGLAFGNSVWASSLVLAAFMAGLALGNLLAASRGDRVRAPLRAYAVLELLVAGTGLALVYLLPHLGTLLAPLRGGLADQPAVLNGLRLLIAFGLLLVPATAMGMTLPLLARALGSRDARFGRVLGLLYGANTLGAVLGVVGTEALWLAPLGIRGSAWVAVLLDVLAAAIAIGLSRRSEPAAPPRAAPGVWRGKAWLAAAFLSGFALLALEVVWLRFLMLFVNDTPMGFAMVLSAVLAGIGVGGLLASIWASRTENADAHAGLAAYVAGLCGLVGYLLFPMVFERVFRVDQPPIAVLAVAAALVFPTSLASGVLFTLIGVGLRRSSPSDASATGRLTFVNTLGAALGPLVAGFLLLPRLGMELSMFGLFALYGVTGILLVSRPGVGAMGRYVASCAFVLCLAAFPFGKVEDTYVRTSAGRWMTADDQILEVREGTLSTIVHVRHGLAGLHLFDQLATNAYTMSVNDFAARRYMKLFVYLPLAVQPQTKRVLIVGHGVGNTAEAVVTEPSVEHLDIVDISEDIIELSRRIQPRYGPAPLQDPRVQVHIEDGRHFMQASRDRYDLITGEPPPPIISGVASLYSREYFQLVHERLAEGGMTTYWLPMMNITVNAAKSIVKGFCEAFEDCSLWHGSSRNFMLVGTRAAGASAPVSTEHFARLWLGPHAAELQATGIELPPQLGAMFVGGADYLREWTGDAPALSDDRPRLMHQPGDRKNWTALLWQWRDTTAARARFEKSELIQRLFPLEVRAASARMFETQRLINDLMFPEPTQARQTRVLHQVLTGTPLRYPVLLMLGSEPDIQRALAAASEAKRKDPVLSVQVAAGLIADRKLTEALRALAGVEERHLPLPGLGEYLKQAAGMQGDSQAGP